MLRTSSYVIYADLPGNDEEVLLVHGYTGAHDKVSRSVAEYLKAQDTAPSHAPLHGSWVTEPALRRHEGNGNGKADRDGDAVSARTRGGGKRHMPVVPAGNTIEQLRRRGYLTPMGPEEEEGHFARLVKKIHNRNAGAAPSYLIMPTYNCNLRCSYCFQDHMRTKDEFRHLLRQMTPEMADRLLAAFPAIEASHGIEPGTSVARRIGFFGGEPLLAASRPIIEYIMDSARRMGSTTFWAVSNATELTAYDGLLGPDGIRYVQITLDGPPEEHDRRRIYADGSGSFDKIARSIDFSLERGVEIHIRMNIDRNNIEKVPLLAEEIVARGWDRNPQFCVYTAPIRAANENTSLKTTFNTWELDQAIDRLRELVPAMRVIGRQDDMIEVRARRVFDTRIGGLDDLKTSFCSAHTTMYVLDAFGDIYACWERTGDASIRIGRVLDDGAVEMHAGPTKLWRSRTVGSNPTCRKCRYALHCGGGCAILAEAQTGKFYANACDGYADRFRFSVAKAYTDHSAGVETVFQERMCDL